MARASVATSATTGSIELSTRWRTNCMRRYGIQIGDSNADSGTLSANTRPGSMIADVPYATAYAGSTAATTAKNASDTTSSIVNAFWKAASWSSSFCWTYLSATPICLSQLSVRTVVITIPQTPNCDCVR